MIEMSDMRATGRLAAKASNVLGGEELGHPVRVLSTGIDLEFRLSYVIRSGSE